jgi:NADPH-dependent curcumin reductase CurA
MTHTVSREIRLKNRPEGLPREPDFELAEVELPEIGEGEILVQNIYMSVDPYMRGRMYDRKSYVPPFQLGMPLDGGCVGCVIQSKKGPFQVGDYVLGMLGWRECFVSDGQGLVKVDPGMGKWIAEGKIKWKETVVDGIENAPKAFTGLFKGENFGKMIVKIGTDPGN